MNNTKKSKLTAEEIQQWVNSEYDYVTYVYENNINDRREIEEHLVEKGLQEEDAVIGVAQILERAEALQRKGNKQTRYMGAFLLIGSVAGVMVSGSEYFGYLFLLGIWLLLQSFFYKKRWVILAIIAILMACLAVCSCSYPQKQYLSRSVAVMKAKLPVSSGGMSDLIDVTYEDDVVTFKYLLNDNFFDYSGYFLEKKILKENFRIMASRYGNIKAMVKQISSADASLRLVYYQKGKVIGIVDINNEELKDNAGFFIGPTEAAKKFLENCVILENKNFPVEINKGMVVKKCLMEEKNIVYEISLDPNIYNMSNLKESDKEEMKDKIMDDMDDMDVNGDVALWRYLKQLRELNMGLCYRYICGGQQVDIVITQAELHNMYKTKHYGNDVY